MAEDALSQDDARALVRSLVELVQMADRALPRSRDALTERVRRHLGAAMAVVPNTSIVLPLIEHANLQVAMNALQADASTWELIGMAGDLGNYGGVSLPGLVAGQWHGPGEAARQYVARKVGPDETLPCLRAGVVLTEFAGRPIALLSYVAERGRPELVVEVVGMDDAHVESVVERLRALMDEHNVMRGKVMTFSFDRHGEFGMDFTTVDDVRREQVIIPAADLEAIEQHALGISEHRDALIAAGQHVKRGLLLYGPPGTGKTHTLSYLLGAMRGRTTVILSGAATGAIGQAGTIARSLQPATIVIEDVDLIGMDRMLPGGDHNAILFQLLNEMDGLSADADVLFVLTTNRVDMLEPALTARPGRIDQAIEIDLPDRAARRQLLDLYLPTGLTAATAEEIAERTDGVAAAFIKELARRATLASIRTGAPIAHTVGPSLTALVEQSAPILQQSLAAVAPTRSSDEPGWAPAPWVDDSF